MSRWAPDWAPRWYFWDGGFLALGRSEGVVPPHDHHAIQITIGIEGEVAFRGGEDQPWVRGHGVIVRPDVVHSFDACGAAGAMLFVDPETPEGQWLLRSAAGDLTVVPASRLEDAARDLRAFHERPLEAMELGPLVRSVVRALCVGPAPARRLDPRVDAVLERVRAGGDPRLSLEDASRMVHLSPSRFAHLFAEHVGLPFRRYLLWRKLTRAMVARGEGLTLTAAAHAGGFSDSAHLTRTFYQMFGIPPSVMLQGELLAVESPFRA